MKRWYRLLFTATFVLIGCDRTERNLNPTETQTATVPEETAPELAAPKLTAPEEIVQQTITFGVVPQFGTKHFAEVWEPLIKRLQIDTGLSIRLIPSSSIPTFEADFAEGRFDFAYMNPYHYLCAKRDQGYKPLIRDQSKQLKGILVVRADSEIQSVKDLEGKTIAFPAPNALGASLYMRALLSRDHQIEFTPRYVNSHDSVYLNVTTQSSVAGGGVKRTLVSQSTKIQSQLRIIYETPGVAPHPIAYHPRVSDEIVQRILQAWIALNDTYDGQELLKQVPMVDPGRAFNEDYLPLEKLALEDFYVTPVQEEEDK